MFSACADPAPPTPPPGLVDATARAALLTTRAEVDTVFLRSAGTDSLIGSTDDLMQSLEYWSSDPDRFLVLADCVSARIEALAAPTTVDE